MDSHTSPIKNSQPLSDSSSSSSISDSSLTFFSSDFGIIKFFATMGVITDAQFHVLAVDDSIIDRKLIERLLRTSSYQVTAVDSGSKALEFLGLTEDEQKDLVPISDSPNQVIEVNLIITDYFMPGMTGYDLLRKIKESASFKDVPVVIMSSENDESRINRCFEQGAEEFFLKPVQSSDVDKLKPHLLRGKSKDCGANNHRNGLGEEINSQRTRYAAAVL